MVKKIEIKRSPPVEVSILLESKNKNTPNDLEEFFFNPIGISQISNINLEPKKINDKEEHSESDGLKFKKNFSIIPNNVLGKMVEKNFSQNEIRIFLIFIRMTLGFKKKWCYLKTNILSEISGLHPKNVNRHINDMIEKGFLKKEKRKGSNENIIIIPSNFLSDDEDAILEKLKNIGGKSVDYFLQDHENDQNVDKQFENRSDEEICLETNSDEVNDFLNKFSTTKIIRKKEKKAFDDLIKNGMDQKEVLAVAMDLIEHGTLNNEKCDRPFTYLASGTYNKLLNRMNGKKDFDPNRIFTAISRYSTREPLPQEFAETLTQKELDWIHNKGGRPSLGQWPENQLKRELHIS